MNIIAITGNLCKDLELRYTGNNKSVMENTLAVRKGIKNKKKKIIKMNHNMLNQKI